MNVADLLTERRHEHAAHVAVMRHLRAAAIEIERVLGGPVRIMHHMPVRDGAGFTVTFERVPDPPAE